MRAQILMMAGTVLLAALSAPARAAKDCPIEPYDIDKVEQAIEATASCKAAYDLMNDCRRNTGGDVGLARVVIAKCERSFVTRGDSPRMRAYRQEREACVARYAKSQGTMYASFQATCEARAAVRAAR